MIRRQPRSTRPDTLFPYPPLCRSQSGYLVWLLKGQPYSDYLDIPETSPKTIVEWSGPIGQIARVPHPWGELHGVAARDAVALTYNRNNIKQIGRAHV